MNGARVQRGFRRLGVGLAAPFLVGAVAALGIYAWAPAESSRPTANYFDKFDPPAKPKSSGLFDDLIPEKRDLTRLSDKELLELYERQKQTPAPPAKPALIPVDYDPFAARNPMPLYWAAGLSGAGGLLFIACVGFGWILAGFARD